MEATAELLAHQGELVSDETSHPLCFVAGVRSGKTWGLCAKALALGMRNGDLPILFVEPSYRMVEDVAVRTFKAVLDAWGVEYEYKKIDGIIRPKLGDGFDILLRSADKPERLMGITAAAAIMDEAGQCKEDVAKELLKRVSHPDAVVQQLVLGGTPEGMNFFQKWAEEPSSPRSRLIRAKTRDNPFLADDYIEQVLSYLSPEEAEQYLEGRFIPPGGRIYHRWDRARHAQRFDDSFRGSRVQMWCDFNISQQAWGFVRVVNGECHVFGECVGEGDTQTRAEIAKERLASMGIRAGEVDVYCDASGTARKTSATMSDVLLLKRAGFKSVRYPKANPAVKDRIASVNLALSEDRLFIDPRGAPYFLSCIEKQGRDKYGEPDKSSGLDHGADAVGYGIHHQFPVKISSRGNAHRYH